MANEAAIVIVAKWKDEASANMAAFGQTIGQTTTKTTALGTNLKKTSGNIRDFGSETEHARLPATRFRYETIALGAALSAVGSLIGKIDTPAAKMISNFLQISGTVMITISSIAHLLPYLSSLVNSLKQVAIWQTIVKALSGPAGWITLGIGAGIGAATVAGISAATSSPRASTTVNNYNIAGSVVTENQVAEITRRNIIKGQGRNAGTSGIR